MIKVDEFVRSLNEKPVAVYGLGLSGLSTAKALKASGAIVKAWDDGEEQREAARAAGIELYDFNAGLFDGFFGLVLAPGIPLHFPEPHLVARKATEAGLPIFGDLEILHRLNHGIETIGITGTNGKSTTTALVAHILKHAGIDLMVGGNIGVPALDLTLPKTGGAIVLEISSYQMDLCPTFRPNISVLLNISPDHLDRHGGIDGYAAAKEKIFEGAGTAICGIDDSYTLAIHDKIVKAGERKVIPVSIKKEVAGGVYTKGGVLFDHIQDELVEVGPVGNIASLPGLHNQQNICAAYAVCRSMGINSAEILDHIKTYEGLAHRQKTVRVINGIAYVNDSKATNGDSAVRAVSCYNNIYLIAGGRAKEGGLSALEPYLDKIRHLFLIGEAMDDFAKWAEAAGVAHTKSHSLDVAVLEAHMMAQSERGSPGGAGTVLLSPACASWDQFKNFEHRGDTFETLVNALSEEVSA